VSDLRSDSPYDLYPETADFTALTVLSGLLDFTTLHVCECKRCAALVRCENRAAHLALAHG
jgi:hypothetical protein